MPRKTNRHRAKAKTKEKKDKGKENGKGKGKNENSSEEPSLDKGNDKGPTPPKRRITDPPALGSNAWCSKSSNASEDSHDWEKTH